MAGRYLNARICQLGETFVRAVVYKSPRKNTTAEKTLTVLEALQLCLANLQSCLSVLLLHPRDWGRSWHLHSRDLQTGY